MVPTMDMNEENRNPWRVLSNRNHNPSASNASVMETCAEEVQGSF